MFLWQIHAKPSPKMYRDVYSMSRHLKFPVNLPQPACAGLFAGVTLPIMTCMTEAISHSPPFQRPKHVLLAFALILQRLSLALILNFKPILIWLLDTSSKCWIDLVVAQPCSESHRTSSISVVAHSLTHHEPSGVPCGICTEEIFIKQMQNMSSLNLLI